MFFRAKQWQGFAGSPAVRLTVGALLGLCLAAGCATGPAAAPQKMAALNRRAIAEYESGDLAGARAALLEAVILGKEAGLGRDPAMAQTYANLGAVYVAGKDRVKGTRHFALALRITPDAQPAPQTVTPPVKKALASAQAALRRKGLLARRPVDRAARAERETARAERETARAERETARAEREAPPAGREPRAERESPGPEREAAAEPRGAKLAAALPPTRKEPALPTGGGEPDLPRALPEALHCPNPLEVPPSEDVALRCATRPGLRPARVLLHYRPAGSERFTAVKMSRTPKGWWSGAVPASALEGKSVHYYFEARGADGPTTNGDAGSPNLLVVRTPGEGEEAPDRDEEVDLREENPLEDLAREQREAARAAAIHRRGPGTLWLALGAGSGYGWHPKRTLELHDGLEVGAGAARAGLFALLPEVGYQITDRYALSLQGRHQLIPGSDQPGTNGARPARSAHAALLRLHRFWGGGNTQVFVTGAAGGGQGFRLIVPSDGTGQLERSDTVRGGPFLLGPGAGLVYHPGRHVALALEMRGLAGIPRFALLGELAATLQASF